MKLPRPSLSRICAAALCTTAALASAPARAEIVDLAFDASGRFSHSGAVAAGKFLEVCGPLALGAQVDWRFEAAAALDFNVHYHEGKSVLYPVQLKQVARASDRLVVSLAQDYCWMWTNRSKAPVSLTLSLQRG